MKKEIKPSPNNNQDQSRSNAKGMTVILSLTIIIVAATAILTLGKKPEYNTSLVGLVSPEKVSFTPTPTPAKPELIENFSPLPLLIVSPRPTVGAVVGSTFLWGTEKIEFDGYVFTTLHRHEGEVIGGSGNQPIYDVEGRMVRVPVDKFRDDYQTATTEAEIVVNNFTLNPFEYVDFSIIDDNLYINASHQMANDRGGLYRLENGDGRPELLLSRSASVITSLANPSQIIYLRTKVGKIYSYGIPGMQLYFYHPQWGQPRLMFEGTDNHLYVGQTKNDVFIFIKMNCDAMPYDGGCGDDFGDTPDKASDRRVEEVFGLRVNWETKTSEVVNIVDSQKLSPVMQKYTYDEDQEKLILTSLDGAPLLTIDVASF